MEIQKDMPKRAAKAVNRKAKKITPEILQMIAKKQEEPAKKAALLGMEMNKF